MRKSLLLVLGIVVITGIVLLLGFDDVYEVLRRITFVEFLFMTIFQVGTLFLTAFIWHYLIKQKNSYIALTYVFSISLAGKFVESVTPSVKIGGETLKMYLIRKKTGLSYQALTAIAVVSKFFSLLPFILISFITLSFAFFVFELPIFVYIAFIGLLLFFILFIVFFKFNRISFSYKEEQNNLLLQKLKRGIKKAHDFIKESSETSRDLVAKPTQKITLFTLGLIVWAFYPIKVYMVSAMLGFDLNPAVVIVATYTAYLVSMVPLLPGGLATFEGTMALLLSYDGLMTSEAFSIALMTRVFTFWVPLIIAAFVTVFLIPKINKENLTEDEDGDLCER
ncbi:lysylphosphatidylglycerol synthase transmembrane domain-containing protein [Natranaerobius trueperi]|uniref:Phosphatidylglycerol lysyltransferase n=1 Tax=Natranaerobius trueperi TaxID=759412 RepID=A0A226BWV6_9FIRM|nr:lysylphosphatidylglycerol synthase transmembrane domain-containing protein [Natranaerobius trueperi]OWZ83528.1 hypothetical protein CDO51_07935 [Natranaerobius trueperi]